MIGALNLTLESNENTYEDRKLCNESLKAYEGCQEGQKLLKWFDQSTIKEAVMWDLKFFLLIIECDFFFIVGWYAHNSKLNAFFSQVGVQNN